MKTKVNQDNMSKSDKKLRTTLGSYINKYYNVVKIHSGINYRSPIDWQRNNKYIRFIGGRSDYVVVGAFFIGMLLIPSDIISQTILALSILLFFSDYDYCFVSSKRKRFN
jgi:hypothetical protein